MGTQLHAVTIDCRDTATMARFWSGVLGGTVHDSGNGYVAVEQVPGLTGRLLFQAVPEDRVGKNRLHLDLTADNPHDEITRMVDLGAVIVDERSDSEFNWWVLADPEGNLFCIG